MCEKCKLEIILYANSYIINRETFANEDTKWRKIKFITKRHINGNVNFFFSTISNQNNPFFAIDYIERCSLTGK